MLRDFEFCFRSARGAGERSAQLLDVAVAAQSPESTARFEKRSADPANEHLAVAPAPDVSRVMGDRTVQVLDGVGAPERTVERAIDAQTAKRERFLHSLAQRACRAGMLARERPGKALQLLERERRILGVPGVVHRAAHTLSRTAQISPVL